MLRTAGGCPGSTWSSLLIARGVDGIPGGVCAGASIKAPSPRDGSCVGLPGLATVALVVLSSPVVFACALLEGIALSRAFWPGGVEAVASLPSLELFCCGIGASLLAGEVLPAAALLPLSVAPGGGSPVDFCG